LHWNVDTHLSNYTVSHPRKLQFSLCSAVSPSTHKVYLKSIYKLQGEFYVAKQYKRFMQKLPLLSYSPEGILEIISSLMQEVMGMLSMRYHACLEISCQTHFKMLGVFGIVCWLFTMHCWRVSSSLTGAK
jgi:hypothetical protein